MADSSEELDLVAQLSTECKRHDLTILVVLDKPGLLFPNHWNCSIRFKGQTETHIGIGKSKDEAQCIASRQALSWIKEHFGSSKTGNSASTPVLASRAMNNTLSTRTTSGTGASVDSTSNMSMQNKPATSLFKATLAISAPLATGSTARVGGLLNPLTPQLQSPFQPKATEPGLTVSKGTVLDTKDNDTQHTSRTLPDDHARSLFGENHMPISSTCDQKYQCVQGCTGGLFCSHRNVPFTDNLPPQQRNGSLFGTSESTSSSLFRAVQPRPCPQGCSSLYFCGHRNLALTSNAQPSQGSSSLFGGSGSSSLFGQAQLTSCPEGCNGLYCNHKNLGTTNNSQTPQGGSSLFNSHFDNATSILAPTSGVRPSSSRDINQKEMPISFGSNSGFGPRSPVTCTGNYPFGTVQHLPLRGFGSDYPSSSIASQPSNNSQQPTSLFGQAVTTSTTDNPFGNTHPGVPAALFGHIPQNVTNNPNGAVKTTNLFGPVHISHDSSGKSSNQNMNYPFRKSVHTTQRQQEPNRFSSSVPVPSMDKLFPQSYVNQSIPTTETAKNNTGTVMVPFQGRVVHEPELYAGKVLHLSITSQPEYQRFCQEELRLVDYLQGYRYPAARDNAEQTAGVNNPVLNFPARFFPNPLPTTDSGSLSKNQYSLTISSVPVPNAAEANALTGSWVANEHVMVCNKYFTPDKSITFATSMLASGPEPLRSVTIKELHRPALFRDLHGRAYEELQALSELFFVNGPKTAKQWIAEAKKYIQAQQAQWNVNHSDEEGEAIYYRLIPAGGMISRTTPPHLPEITLPQFGLPAPQSAIIARATTLLNDICEIICNRDNLPSCKITTEEWLNIIDSFFAAKLASHVNPKADESSSTDEASGSGFHTPELETTVPIIVPEAVQAAMVPLPVQLSDDVSENGKEKEDSEEDEFRSTD